MNKTLILIGIFLFILPASPAFSYQEGKLEISQQQVVYYKYQKPENQQPTIVLLNGLIYAIDNWNEYFQAMADKGYGVLQIAYSTQPESLAYLDRRPYYAETEMTFQGLKQVGIETQTLVDEVMAVVNSLKIRRFNVLSLSYGSIVASRLAVQQRDRIDHLIIVAPAVMSSHRYHAYGQSRHAFYLSQKVLGYPIDYYYDLELYNTMSALISPAQYSFEGVSYQDFFHGVFQMARSSKWFDLKDYADKQLPLIYLFLASREDKELYKDQMRFWNLLSGNKARRSLVKFKGGYHALPGVAPVLTADMSDQVMRGDLKKGEYEVIVSEDDIDDNSKKTSSF